jgi:hypothetical protein
VVGLRKVTVVEMRSKSKEGGSTVYVCEEEITAPGESDRTASVRGLLRFNGPNKLAVDEEHVATITIRTWSRLGRETPNFGWLSPKQIKFGPKL